MNSYSHDQRCRRGAACLLVLLAGLMLGLEARAQELPVPVVSIVATRDATSEPRPEARIAPGEFTIRRTGPVEEALDVLVVYRGTATPGVDYERLPESVTLPAGKAETTWMVVALDDDQVEGEETVVAAIVLPPALEHPTTETETLPLLRYVIDSTREQARIVIHDADKSNEPDEATIRWIAPEPGSHFEAGSVIPIRVVAVDPEGYIGRVEFFSGSESIGVSEIVFIRAPDPGTPIEHSLDWEGAPPGEHVLTARAVDSSGHQVESKRVPVFVGIRSEVVIVGVEAADPKASEPNGASPAGEGAFLIRRLGGPRDVDVPVHYALGGDAVNGADYERLTGRTDLPAGVDTVRVVVTPLADRAKEGEERVVLELESPVCPAIFPPPPWCYQIAASGSAAVVIRDGESQSEANRPPTVRIVSPRSGSAYLEGEVIVVRAEATDPDGTIERLDIFVDETLLGSTEDGALNVEWREAGTGLHKLRALALDNGGREARSPVVTVFVRATEDVAFVRRDLPPAYLPGATLDVLLVANPPRGGVAWTVEDVPPTGWAVSEISSDGVLDAATGKVKFGPFTDTETRRLLYRVTAPVGATGAQTFTGLASLDGQSFPVAGDETLQPAGENHPADESPADKAIVANEVTAYAAAWKQGNPWGTDGGAIPLAYVTRAGQIWREGEGYVFDAAAGAPPACWVPSPTQGESTAGIAVDRAARGLAGVAVGLAERDTPVVQQPGHENVVQIRVVPPTGTHAVAVEECVPPGWRVASISDEGVFDAGTRRIRWGLFYGDTPRTLTFKATPPSGVAGASAWKGTLSFDGTELAITGVERVGAADAATLPRIRGSKRGAHGQMHFQVDASADQVLVIEGSDDLKSWKEIGASVFTGEEIVVTDAAGEAAGARYYRLRPLSR